MRLRPCTARTFWSTSVPLVLDVRWQLTDPPGAGRERYLHGHIPQAVYAGIETVFTHHTGVPGDGRHPLPDQTTLVAAVAALGVRPARAIAIVDEPGSFAAERAWWALAWVGVPSRVLDGGIDAWTAAGLPLQPGPVAAEPVPPFPVETGMRTATADDAATAGADPSTVLVDVRAPDRFAGEVEPLDPVAGHIPGAINIPVAQFYTGTGALPDAGRLQALLSPAGRQPVVYCGSGVSAARVVLALASIGVDARLYPGSWSAWCNDPARPVATGA
ncbi:MAG: sulfurtransferase [Micrococcales bacterium]|nr:MAG: sulfurtransferase [Micrococcales bacterium]